MWSFLPIECLTDWQPSPYAPQAPPTRLRSLERVALVKHGTVSYERSGFAMVRWDDGTESLCWTAELRRAA